MKRIPGYDGEYGKIELFDPSERNLFSGQISLFPAVKPSLSSKTAKKEIVTDTERQIEIIPFEEEQMRLISVKKASFLEELNENQKSAAQAMNKITAVIAGPGTGKTKTLVSKIAYLVENCHISPSEITTVTFTNKAAAEMRNRLQSHFVNQKIDIEQMTIGTFHAICLQLLTEWGKTLRLADEYEKMDTARDTLKENSCKISASKFLKEISKQKNGVHSDAGLSENLFTEYDKKLHQKGLLDFDDLLCMVENDWEMKKAESFCENRFSYLLVDEFQDINELQYRLIKKFIRNGKQLFVIGDPDQSIYSFRGSDSRCFERLFEDFPESTVVHLTENYRSTPEILNSALSMISHNPLSNGLQRGCRANQKNGLPISLISSVSDLSEGIFIAKEINRLLGGIDMLDTIKQADEGEGIREFSDFAVLYRTHRQAETLEKCFQKEGIPYQVVGKESFLDDPIVRGTICYFRFLQNPADSLSFTQALSLLWGLTETESEETAKEWAAIGITPFPDRIEQIQEHSVQKEKLKEFFYLSRLFYPKVSRLSPQTLFEEWIAQTGYMKKKALTQFVNLSASHQTLQSLFETITLGKEADFIRTSKQYTSGVVSLMTLHAAKGLEFPIVFLCGVKAGTIPLESENLSTSTEEERRLFYVGMTRAKEKLYLLTSSEPSVFLGDIPDNYLESKSAAKPKKPKEEKQLSLF